MIPTENAEQATLFQWAELASGARPELRLLYAIPNGGLRDGRTAAILARTGVKSGVPDLCLPVARGGWHSLYLELKRAKGGRVSENQKNWINALNDQGNKAVVCHGFEQAKQAIMEYLDGEMP
jgi:hypothetical protein